MTIQLKKHHFNYRKYLLLVVFFLLFHTGRGAFLLIPMDNTQQDHIKAYGVAYWVLSHDIEISWLLNYKGGSFLIPWSERIDQECRIRGVSAQVIGDAQASVILQQIADQQINMETIKLHKAPKIAVYSPKNKQPWDDAVTLVLTYAEIPYDIVYDEEIHTGILPLYDWLHLHHEDFTGQYGKFWAAYKNHAWYQEEVRVNEALARKLGFSKVSHMKLETAKKIRDFVAGGGYLFSMCSAPDSYDVALAADGIDICDVMFDGDPPDPDAQNKLNYTNCFAFENFTISVNPYEYEISSIDVTASRPPSLTKQTDLFSLFDFSAKWDPIPTMLCQNHESIISGFMGQTTAFNKRYLKSSVLVMGENKSFNEVRYIHGDFGKGTWTFLGGHDPEDYQHLVGDPPTELNLHPNSPGYRLILNNILFPAARKEKRKT